MKDLLLLLAHLLTTIAKPLWPGGARKKLDLGSTPNDLRIREIYRQLTTDKQRNNLTFDDVLQASEEGRSPILLTERKEHLEYFADRLRKFTRRN